MKQLAHPSIRLSTLALCLAALSACGGGGDDGTPPTGVTVTTPTSNPAAVPGIYITNANNTVTVFNLDASGNVAPARRIAGAATGLSLPIGIAADKQGNLFVANRSSGKVSVFPIGATGNVAPTRTLTNPGMGSPQALAFGPGDDLYVATCPNCGAGNGGDTAVFHFPLNATAADYSISGSNTGLTVPIGISLDSSKNLYVGNAFGGKVSLFAAGNTGNTMPIRSFTPASNGNAQSINLGANGGANAIALAVPGHGIDLYDYTASGTATPVATLAPSAALPLSYPGGVFFDNSVTPPIVYLNDYGSSSVYVIQTVGTAPNLTVGSVKIIAGSNTGLSAPLGITVVH